MPVIITVRSAAERHIVMISCLSVCPSVCNAGGLDCDQSHALEFVGIILGMIDLTLGRPQHHGSTPMGTPPNFSRNSGVGKMLIIDL